MTREPLVAAQQRAEDPAQALRGHRLGEGGGASMPLSTEDPQKFTAMRGNSRGLA